MKFRQATPLVLLLILSTLTACEGTFDWVYDKVTEDTPPKDDTEIKGSTVQGQFYLDASDWKMWYYLDIPAAIQSFKADTTYNVSNAFVALPIPFESTGPEETQRGEHRLDGQYMYYFDVFNQGLSNNQFTSFRPTPPQPEPDTWTIAFHRNNMRTNGLAAYETTLTDITLVTEDMCKSVTDWQEDEWSENEVWNDQSTMLSCYIPSQGIKVNRVLSSWLTIHIPPVPPTFSMSNNVRLLRMSDGTYCALQLVNYMSTTGKKCCMTVKYRYPI